MIVKEIEGEYWVMKSGRSKEGFRFPTMNEAVVKQQTIIIENAIAKLQKVTVNNPEAAFPAGHICMGLVGDLDQHNAIEHPNDPAAWRC